jgi:hypothetical protein
VETERLTVQEQLDLLRAWVEAKRDDDQEGGEAIERQTGEALGPGYVVGQDSKLYAPKVTVQEYEVEPGYGEPVAEDRLSTADHLTNALASLQRAQDTLQEEGTRNPEVASMLAEIRQAAAQVLATNKALPRAPKEGTPEE